MKTTIQTLAALLVAAVATTACSSGDDNIIGEQPTPDTQQPTTKYTMTVEATKGGDTRALSLDGTTLNATWTAGDKVEVWSSDGTTVKYGTLIAQSSGSSTTLTGEMVFLPTLSTGLSLLLKYLSNDYSKQTGTLDYIADHCDYATARVEVTGISGSEITTTPATFQNQQAIIKFTLKDSDSAIFNPSTVTITYGTSTVSLDNIPDDTYTANGNGVLYMAFPATGSSATITLTATADSKVYSYTKEDVSFGNGKYYDISVKMVHSLSHAIATDCGMVVCAAGHLHKAKTAVPDGCTAVGILGKVTETGHGLILSLQDTGGEIMWDVIMKGTYETECAGTTLKVLSETIRGSLPSYTALGKTAVSDWALAQKNDYAKIFENLGSTTSTKTYDDNVNLYITTGVGGTALSDGETGHGYWTATTDYDSYYERNLVWIFWKDWMSTIGNMDLYSRKVRPVLGF